MKHLREHIVTYRKYFFVLTLCVGVMIGYSLTFRQMRTSLLPVSKGVIPADSSGCVMSRSTKIVRGDSMFPAFSNGEEVVALMGYYACHPVLRGDVVLVRPVVPGADIIKFVFGVPGDVLAFQAGASSTWNILVNGKVLVNSAGRPYALEERKTTKISAYIRANHGVIPPDYYLILGDMPEGSYDSTEYGLYWIGSIVARVNHH